MEALGDSGRDSSVIPDVQVKQDTSGGRRHGSNNGKNGNCIKWESQALAFSGASRCG